MFFHIKNVKYLLVKTIKKTKVNNKSNKYNIEAEC